MREKCGGDAEKCATETRRHRDTSEYESLDAISHEATIEIDEQTDTFVSRSKICEQLRIQHGVRALHALHFDDDDVGHDEIDPVLAKQASLVESRNPDLMLVSHGGVVELDTQCRLVRSFEETRAQHAMHLDRAADDLLGDVVDIH